MAENARFYMTSPESPLISMRGDRPLASKDWYTLFWQLYNGVTNGVPQTESAIAVGASPFTFTSTIKGQVSVVGGTGLTIEFSRNGKTFYAAGTQPCMVPVCKADRIRVTYATAPAMTFIPM